MQRNYENVAIQLGLSKSGNNEQLYNLLIDKLLSSLKSFLHELEETNT